jgi:SAM-dependent methyltransferase
MSIKESAEFWDNYVRLWQEKEGVDPLIGSEWGAADGMKDLIKTYSKGCKNAVEIGCGGGRITEAVCNLFERLYAYDVSPAMVAECYKRIVPNKGTQVSVELVDGISLPHEDNSVDMVFSHDVFVHFNNNTVYMYLKEIARVLKKKGICIISFYNLSYTDNFKDFKSVSAGYCKAGILFNHKPHHIYHISDEFLDLFCEDVGLKKIKEVYTGHAIYVLRKV